MAHLAICDSSSYESRSCFNQLHTLSPFLYAFDLTWVLMGNKNAILYFEHSSSTCIDLLEKIDFQEDCRVKNTWVHKERKCFQVFFEQLLGKTMCAVFPCKNLPLRRIPTKLIFTKYKFYIWTVCYRTRSILPVYGPIHRARSINLQKKGFIGVWLVWAW